MGAILAQGRATPPLPSGAGVLHRRIKHEADLLEIIRSIHHRAAGVAGLCDGVGGGMSEYLNIAQALPTALYCTPKVDLPGFLPGRAIYGAARCLLNDHGSATQ